MLCVSSTGSRPACLVRRRSVDPGSRGARRRGAVLQPPRSEYAGRGPFLLLPASVVRELLALCGGSEADALSSLCRRSIEGVSGYGSSFLRALASRQRPT